MAIAIAAAGAAIGGALAPGAIGFLGLTGASAGWLAGSLLGSLFTPKAKAFGPRLGDKRVMGSEYGACIPWVAGTPRLAGQVVWASDIREIATTTEQGKGGGGSEYTSYTYEVDVFIVLTENWVPGVSRIWKYGELVWNKSATADAATVAASDATDAWSRITFYDGADDQLPDPDYEAAVGTVNAQAFRGRTGVFIKDLQLGNSNQPPNLTFELADSVAYGAIVAGASTVSTGGRIDQPRVVALDATHALISYRRQLLEVYARVATITSGVVSFAGETYVSFANGQNGDMCALDANTVICAYSNAGGSTANARLMSVSGTTASRLGSEYVIDAAHGGSIMIVALDSTHAVMTWGVTTQYASLLTVSGSTITFTTPQTVSGITAPVNGQKGLCRLSSSSAVLAGSAAGSFQAVAAMTVSGGVLTLGSAQINNIAFPFVSAAAVDAGTICALYNNGGVVYGNRVAISGLSASYSNTLGHEQALGGPFTAPAASLAQGRVSLIPTVAQALCVGGNGTSKVQAMMLAASGNVNQWSPVTDVNSSAIYASGAVTGDCLTRDLAIAVWEGPSPTYYLEAAALDLT